jgi:hypothetical protein
MTFLNSCNAVRASATSYLGGPGRHPLELVGLPWPHARTIARHKQGMREASAWKSIFVILCFVEKQVVYWYPVS